MSLSQKQNERIKWQTKNTVPSAVESTEAWNLPGWSASYPLLLTLEESAERGQSGGGGGSLCRVCLNVTLLPLNWIKCGNHKIAGDFCFFFLFVFPVSFPFCDQGDVKGWNHPWYSAWARRDLRCVVYTVHKYFIGCDYFWKSLWNGLQITRGRRGVTGRQIKESTGENSIKVILKKLQRVGDGRLPAAGEYFPWRRSNTQETTTWHDEIILKK